MEQEHLSQGSYLDLNEVPTREKALQSRGFHEKPEDQARLKDRKELEAEKKQLQQKAQTLREKAFSTCPPS